MLYVYCTCKNSVHMCRTHTWYTVQIEHTYNVVQVAHFHISLQVAPPVGPTPPHPLHPCPSLHHAFPFMPFQIRTPITRQLWRRLFGVGHPQIIHPLHPPFLQKQPQPCVCFLVVFFLSLHGTAAVLHLMKMRGTPQHLVHFGRGFVNVVQAILVPRRVVGTFSLFIHRPPCPGTFQLLFLCWTHVLVQQSIVVLQLFGTHRHVVARRQRDPGFPRARRGFAPWLLRVCRGGGGGGGGGGRTPLPRWHPFATLFLLSLCHQRHGGPLVNGWHPQRVHVQLIGAFRGHCPTAVFQIVHHRDAFHFVVRPSPFAFRRCFRWRGQRCFPGQQQGTPSQHGGTGHRDRGGGWEIHQLTGIWAAVGVARAVAAAAPTVAAPTVCFSKRFGATHFFFRPQQRTCHGRCVAAVGQGRGGGTMGGNRGRQGYGQTGHFRGGLCGDAGRATQLGGGGGGGGSGDRGRSEAHVVPVFAFLCGGCKDMATTTARRPGIGPWWEMVRRPQCFGAAGGQ